MRNTYAGFIALHSLLIFTLILLINKFFKKVIFMNKSSTLYVKGCREATHRQLKQASRVLSERAGTKAGWNESENKEYLWRLYCIAIFVDFQSDFVDSSNLKIFIFMKEWFPIIKGCLILTLKECFPYQNNRFTYLFCLNKLHIFLQLYMDKTRKLLWEI